MMCPVVGHLVGGGAGGGPLGVASDVLPGGGTGGVSGGEPSNRSGVQTDGGLMGGKTDGGQHDLQEEGQVGGLGIK